MQDILELTLSFVVALFFVPLCCDFMLVLILGVVCIVLRLTYCLYVPLFRPFQGNVFQFQCMYALPHLVKKYIVLS